MLIALFSMIPRYFSAEWTQRHLAFCCQISFSGVVPNPSLYNFFMSNAFTPSSRAAAPGAPAFFQNVQVRRRSPYQVCVWLHGPRRFIAPRELPWPPNSGCALRMNTGGGVCEQHLPICGLHIIYNVCTASCFGNKTRAKATWNRIQVRILAKLEQTLWSGLTHWAGFAVSESSKQLVDSVKKIIG